MSEKIWEMSDCWTSGGRGVKNLERRGLPLVLNIRTAWIILECE